MISFIQGKIKFFDHSSVVVDVGGVGYRVFCPSPVLEDIQVEGKEVGLYIHSYIREDRFDLFGFLSRDDLDLFRLLIGVSGVGPRTALQVFSAGGSSVIKSALSGSEVDFFSSVPGIGKKTAQKIVIELRGKMGALDDSLESVLEGKEDEEVVLALKQLGYQRSEIKEAIKGLDKKLPISERVKAALRLLSKHL